MNTKNIKYKIIMAPARTGMSKTTMSKTTLIKDVDKFKPSSRVIEVEDLPEIYLNPVIPNLQ